MIDGFKVEDQCFVNNKEEIMKRLTLFLAGIRKPKNSDAERRIIRSKNNDIRRCLESFAV